ncbi:hypothetical protein ACKF11_13735 [Methylobacillus sp. Pita2]|uniref:hypothetical protein n=1 Tax=Methylobacillus sp. Pita2 TaxID=3383245 RepID=UPI0038B43F1B
MAYQLKIKIPELPETTNAARHANGHWSTRAKKDRGLKMAIWHLILEQGKPRTPLARAKVTLIRHSSSEPDYEGLVSSFKPVLDCLTESGVIVDDNCKVLGIPTYLWGKAKPKAGYSEVIVEEISDDFKLPSFRLEDVAHA